MTIHKTGLLMIGLGIVAISGITLNRLRKKPATGLTIGILQTASHPALDAVRTGFKERLSKEIPGVAFIEQNAQGSTNAAHMIAQSFAHNEQIAAVLAIATPAAQAAAEAITTKPIIFAAVSDPKAAGLCAPHRSKICGVADTINAADQRRLITTLVPSARTIALLFNKGEVNAVSMVAQLEAEFKQHGLVTIQCCVTNESEIPHAVSSACGKADLILAPIDNTVACTIDCIAQMALSRNIPLFVSDNLLVKHGALAARGVDYAQSGATAAGLTHKILVERQEPAKLGIVSPSSQTIFINKKTAATLNISVPKTIGSAEIVEVDHA